MGIFIQACNSSYELLECRWVNQHLSTVRWMVDLRITLNAFFFNLAEHCSPTRTVMDGHRFRVFAVSFHPERETQFISGGWDNTIQVKDSFVYLPLSFIILYCCINVNVSLDTYPLQQFWRARVHSDFCWSNTPASTAHFQV